MCFHQAAERPELHFIRKRNNRGIDAECIEDAFSYGKGDIAEVIVKEHVVRVRIDKSDFDKNRRHFCASEDNEPGAGFYSEIYKTDPLKLFVYIFRHLQFNAGFVVDKRFDSRDSVILRKELRWIEMKKSTPASFASIAF